MSFLTCNSKGKTLLTAYLKLARSLSMKERERPLARAGNAWLEVETGPKGSEYLTRVKLTSVWSFFSFFLYLFYFVTLIYFWLRSYACHVVWIQQKTYQAAIGDLTITAERMQYVDFTAPYVESGVAMIVPAKPLVSALMFMKPFTWDMWLVTGVILIYTMLTVWFLEHQSNPDFSGSWKNQISTALWFTFSSLFFAHSKYQF